MQCTEIYRECRIDKLPLHSCITWVPGMNFVFIWCSIPSLPDKKLSVLVDKDHIAVRVRKHNAGRAAGRFIGF